LLVTAAQANFVPALAGSTLWFRNCREDGQVDERSLHGGDPVEQGEKWVVTKWFRVKPTKYLEFYVRRE
jgi:hypothetical protein